VLTAVTAQNTTGVQAAELLAPALVRQQLSSVLDDLPVTAVKTGMLGTPAVIEVVAAALREYRPRHFVLDPVIVARSGDRLVADDAVDALCRELIPLATVLTPNVHEASVLTGSTIRDAADAERAARVLLDRGARAVVVTGGALPEPRGMDLLVTRDGTRRCRGDWIDTTTTHGTGCTHSAMLASLLAQGASLPDAVDRAKQLVTEAIRAGLSIGRGHGPPDPFHFLPQPERQ